jgi:hypothetical protein
MRLNWKLVLVSLEIVLILTQDGCMVCVERAIGLQTILTHQMELLYNVGLMESHFGPFGCKIGARFAPNIPKAQISFWTNPMVPLSDAAQLEARFGPFGDSANIEQDRSTV